MTNNSSSNRQAALDRRIGELEQVTTTLRAESAATRNDVEKLTISVDRLAQTVGEWMRTSGRPNWGWIVGAVGLLATIGGLAAAPFIRDIQRQDIEIRALELQQNGVNATRWSREDHEVYRERDERHDREMEERLMGLIRELDDELDEHTSNGHPYSVLDQLHALRDDYEETKDELQRRGDWMRETDVERAAADAAYAARLDQLEADVDEISSEQRRRTTRVYGPGEDGN